jgi:hypothetical protein
MSHAAADVIFRTLFSIPIENAVAAQVFPRIPRLSAHAQPILNLAAFLPCRAGCRACTAAPPGGQPPPIRGLIAAADRRPRRRDRRRHRARRSGDQDHDHPDPLTGEPSARRDGRSGGDLLSGRA